MGNLCFGGRRKLGSVYRIGWTGFGVSVRVTSIQYISGLCTVSFAVFRGYTAMPGNGDYIGGYMLINCAELNSSKSLRYGLLSGGTTGLPSNKYYTSSTKVCLLNPQLTNRKRKNREGTIFGNNTYGRNGTRMCGQCRKRRRKVSRKRYGQF
jgi:hypothetical protein